MAIVQSASTWMSHPKGYFQPGVLALSQQGRVLYRWRCRPSRQNVGVDEEPAPRATSAHPG